MLKKPTNMLTTAELAVMESLKKGHTNKLIAADLLIKEKTVKYHLTNIYRKLGVKSDRQLLALSITTEAVVQ